MIRFRRDWSAQFDDVNWEIEEFQASFVVRKPQSFRLSRRTWEPVLDVYETADEVVVVVELAGVKQEEIEVLVDGHTLCIRGIRRDSMSRRQRGYHQVEIRRGPFERRVALPTSVDPERIDVYYENGLLEIVMAKAAI